MELKYLPEFTVIGKAGEGLSDSGPSWIVPLWDQFNKDFGQISGIALKNAADACKGIWGLMGNPGEFLGRWTSRGT